MSSHDYDAPDDRVAYQVIAASHELRAAVEDLLGPLGVTMAQWTVLVQLLLEPGRSSADIARSSAVSQQAISGLVSRLERDGLLTRAPHPEHGRIQQLATTPEGARIAFTGDAAMRRLEGDLREYLGPADAEVLRTLLERVRQFVEERRGQSATGRRPRSATD